MNLALGKENAANVFSIIAQKEKSPDAFSLQKWKKLTIAQLTFFVRHSDKG
jgi:hypothetical protein